MCPDEMKTLLRPAFLAPFAVIVATSLSSCTSAQDALEPSALVGGETLASSPALQPAQQSDTTTPAILAAIPHDARVQFAQVVGAPSNASAPLSARLSASAATRGISLVAPGQPSANLFMKGYFSAITEDSQTIVIYVWDVVDQAGTRIHRIQGQAKAPAGAGEGWDSVQPSTMEAIADETIDRLTSWLASQPA